MSNKLYFNWSYWVTPWFKHEEEKMPYFGNYLPHFLPLPTLVYNPDRRHGHRTRGCLHPGPSACPDKWDRSLCPHLPPHLPQTRSPLSLHQSLRLNYLLPHHHHHLPLHLHHLFHPLFPSLRDERIYITCHLKKALVINKFTLRNTYSVIQRTCLPLNLLWTSNIYSLSISVNNCENQKMNHVQ